MDRHNLFKDDTLPLLLGAKVQAPPPAPLPEWKTTATAGLFAHRDTGAMRYMAPGQPNVREELCGKPNLPPVLTKPKFVVNKKSMIPDDIQESINKKAEAYFGDLVDTMSQAVKTAEIPDAPPVPVAHSWKSAPPPKPGFYVASTGRKTSARRYFDGHSWSLVAAVGPLTANVREHMMDPTGPKSRNKVEWLHEI